MPEITPDTSDRNRCISVHWSLPVQCTLPASHRENNHQTWHPQTGARLRYQRTMGTWRTEALTEDGWERLEIPPPGGYCGDASPSNPDARCSQQYGHGWNHSVVHEGCRYSWNTPVPPALTASQLHGDVRQLRGAVVEQAADLERARRIAVQLEQENARLHEQASTLADRWTELADGTAASLATGDLDDAIEYVRTGRELVFRSAARDLRWLLANGNIPHWLMTSEELGEPGTEPTGGAS